MNNLIANSMTPAYSWYATLIKPFWAPPSWIFGPVWTVLYILIAISFGYVFYLVIKKRLPAIFALPFILNLIFNLVFSPIQFNLQNLWLASVDILLVLATLIWLVKTALSKKKTRWVGFINMPYLAWVSFATILQLTVTFLNW